MIVKPYYPRGLAKAMLVISVLPGQVACDGGTPAAVTLALRDSAGVAIFAASADPREIGTWTVGKSPELLIGEAQDGEPLYEVRAGGQFADGSFVIANEGSYELRFYSREGALERSVGRQGAGPKEFGSLDFLQVIADSVWVYDRGNQRISVLDRAGEFVRLIPLLGAVSNTGFVLAEGVFDDGSILLLAAEPRTTIEPGLRHDYRRVFVLSPDGSISELGRFFWWESYWVPVEGSIVDAGRPFGRRGLTAVHGSEWFYTGGEQYRVGQYDTAGRLGGVYSYPAEPRSVAQRDLEEYLKEFRAEVGGPSLRERLLRRAPLPERMPAYAGLLIDREGNVWAAPHTGANPQNCWHVYQRQPLLFATVCLPDQFTVLDIAGASILGVLRNENDVEHIARYRLMK